MQGQVRVFGENPRLVRRNIAYLSRRRIGRFPISVWDVVLQGRMLRRGLWGRLTAEDRAPAALIEFGSPLANQQSVQAAVSAAGLSSPAVAQEAG